MQDIIQDTWSGSCSQKVGDSCWKPGIWAACCQSTEWFERRRYGQLLQVIDATCIVTLMVIGSITPQSCKRSSNGRSKVLPRGRHVLFWWFVTMRSRRRAPNSDLGGWRETRHFFYVGIEQNRSYRQTVRELKNCLILTLALYESLVLTGACRSQ